MQKRILSFVLIVLLILPVLAVAGGFLFAPKSPFTLFDEMRQSALNSSVAEDLSDKGAFYSTDELSSENRYIVQFSQSATYEEIEAALKDVPYRLLAESKNRLFALSPTEGFLEKHKDIIEYYEIDQIRQTQAITNDPISIPAYENMGIPTVWDSVNGSSKVIVAVLDTGLDRNHQELYGANILAGYDAVMGKTGVNDDASGHGTAVIGLIAATANNGYGFAGVAHGVSILPVKVSAGGNAIFSSDLISGIRFAADAGVKIINMSVGGFSSSYAEQAAVDYAISKGCIMIGAAGNSGALSYGDKKSYPASYEGVISVASCDLEGNKSDFSQYNEKVDIAAPGENLPLISPADGEDAYLYGSGTSYSCAFVSGIAALAAVKIGDVRFESDEFLALIIETCGSKRSDELGYGVINAPKIVSATDSPIITGVYHNGVFNESVKIGFNRGSATLDGVPIDDGEMVMTNGSHLLSVTYGEITRNIRFSLNYSPLSYKYNSFSTFVSFDFSRGSATLDGFPYISGEKISTSGDHLFVLIDGDERVEKSFTISYSIPYVFGVEDGATYEAPVDIRVVGDGSATLNGEPVYGRVTATNGAYELIVRSLNGNLTKTYHFTINSSVSVMDTDYSDASAAVDEENEFICLYGDSLVGARIYDINNPSTYLKFLLVGRIYSHYFTETELVLLGDDGITIIDRSTAKNGTESIKSQFNIAENGYYFGSEEGVYFLLENSLYQVDLNSESASLKFTLSKDAYWAAYSQNNILLCNNDNTLSLLTVSNGSIRNLGISADPAQNKIYFGNGFIAIDNLLYSMLDGALQAELPAQRIIAIHGENIITENMVFALSDYGEIGRLPFEISDLVFGNDKNYIFGTDPLMARADADAIGMTAYCGANSALGFISAPEAINDYRKGLFYDKNSKVISATGGMNLAFFALADDNRIFSFDIETLKENQPLTLKYIPKKLVASGDYLVVIFDKSNEIYIASQNDIYNGIYADMKGKTTSATFFNGKIYTSTNGKLSSILPSGSSLATHNFSADEVATSMGGLVLLRGNNLSLLNKNHALIQQITVAKGALSAGNGIAVGNKIYHGETLAELYVLPREVISFGGDIIVTPQEVYQYSTGEALGDLGVSSLKAAICGNRAVIGFGAALISVNAFEDGRNILEIPEVAGVQEGGVYHDSVIFTYNFGNGYVDGSAFISGGSVAGAGGHIFSLVLPFGRKIEISFIIEAHLSSIEFLLKERTMSVGETITLRVKYLPSGASSVPVSFVSSGDGISVDENGNVTASAEGVYMVAAVAETHVGSFSAQCRITVRNDLIAFTPESGIVVDRDKGYITEIPAGLTADELLALLYSSKNAYVYDKNGTKLKGFVGTGCEIVLYDKNGNVCDRLKTIIMGDTDGDGIISAYDLYEQGRILRGYSYDEIFVLAADINENGAVADDDYRMLKYMVLGRTPYDLGIPEQLLFSKASIQTLSYLEEGSVIEVALCISGNKYARGIMGSLEYSDSLEFLGGYSNGWETVCYENAGNISFFAYGKNGEAVGKAFSTLLTLKFRIVGEVGSDIKISSHNMVVSLSDGSKKLNFTEFSSKVMPIVHGDFDVKISNVEGFEFNEDDHDYTITIPYNSAMADISLVRPEGSDVFLEDLVVPMEGENYTIVTYTDIQGRTKFYSIHVKREKEPNFDTNCHLENLEIEGFHLEPSFNPDVLEYNVYVTHGTEKLNIHCDAKNSSAEIFISDTEIKGENGVITITVVAPDGESLVYTLNVTVLPPEDPSENIESDISVAPPVEKGGFGWIIVLIALVVAAGGVAFFIYQRKK